MEAILPAPLNQVPDFKQLAKTLHSFIRDSEQHTVYAGQINSELKAFYSDTIGLRLEIEQTNNAIKELTSIDTNEKCYKLISMLSDTLNQIADSIEKQSGVLNTIAKVNALKKDTLDTSLITKVIDEMYTSKKNILDSIEHVKSFIVPDENLIQIDFDRIKKAVESPSVTIPDNISDEELHKFILNSGK